MPPCGCWRSTRIPASPSAGRCWRRSSDERVHDGCRLAIPRRVAVPPPTGRHARSVDGQEVDAIRESWLVEDRWWTERPLRRRYWEVVTVCGRNEVVFRDLIGREVVAPALSGRSTLALNVA